MKLTLTTPLFYVVAAVGSAQAPSPDADNTKMNKRDQTTGAKTADQQKMNANDQELTRNIRKAIIADKTLSTYAHNIKIITSDGMVTLKGPVNSDAEKKTVIAKAVEVTHSAQKITDQISVKR
ncbi:MAG: BON domain-containing protein [Bryobacteraceae bacterium]|nr:BON domain-containing protein [Bryobacteraceae bacterium]